MKKIQILALFLLAVLVFTPAVYGQTAITHTTLSTTLSDTSGTQVVVASATGITASTTAVQRLILIDQELMRVTGVSGTTLTVLRNQGGLSSPHTSGATVIFGPGGGTFNPANGSTQGVFIGAALPRGRCTAANNQYLPVVTFANNNWALYNCNNSQWVAQTMPDDVAPTLTRYCTPPFLGALALLTTNGNANAPFVVGNNQTPVAGSVYYGTIEIPRTMRVTGISHLNGTVAGTDTVINTLYRADGVKIASSAATTASGADRFQDLDLSAVQLVTGPARYWVAYQTNGTTTRFRNVNLTPGATTAGLGAFIGLLGSSFTGTAGTLPNLTASTAGSSPGTSALPTSLINATSPIACVY